MEDYDYLRQELFRDRRWVVGRSQHRTAMEVGLRDAPQVEADVVPGLCLLHGRVVGLAGLYLSGKALGPDDDRVAGLHLAGLYSPHGDCAYACDRVHVLDGDPERLFDRLRRFGELV